MTKILHKDYTYSIYFIFTENPIKVFAYCMQWNDIDL